MDQDLIYENYLALLSDNPDRKRVALLEKQKWILDSFFIPFSLYDKRGLMALDQLSLPFNRLTYRTIETRNTWENTDEFNENYRYIDLYEDIPLDRNKNTFFVQVNFRKLPRPLYLKLFPTFFPCLERDMFYDRSPLNGLSSLFSKAVEGDEGENVIILNKNMLNSNGFYELGQFSCVYIHSDLKDQDRLQIEQTAARHKLRVKHIYAN